LIYVGRPYLEGRSRNLKSESHENQSARGAGERKRRNRTRCQQPPADFREIRGSGEAVNPCHSVEQECGRKRSQEKIFQRRFVVATVVALLLPVTVSTTSVQADASGAEPPANSVIPALGVRANVETVGLADDGSMGIPDNFSETAWYSLGASPGQAGYAAFTGHVSSTAAPGVFYNIDELAPGNTIHITDTDGTEMVLD